MKLLLMFMLFFVSDITRAIDVYTWVDNEGVVHFSDYPKHPQASLLVLPNPVVPTTTHHESVKVNTGTPIPKPQNSTIKIAILSPTHDATIRNNLGNFDVVGHVEGKLNTSTQLQLLLDSRVFGDPKTTPHWSLTSIDRGTHTLTIQARKNGKVIASSNTITVHLHRASVQSP